MDNDLRLEVNMYLKVIVGRFKIHTSQNHIVGPSDLISNLRISII